MDQAGIKASDIWLFGCFLVVILINLSHIAINNEDFSKNHIKVKLMKYNK